MDRCEEMIITDTTKVSNVKLADIFGLKKLRNHSVTQIGTYFPLANIIEGEDYVSLSEASKHDLLCMRIKTMEDKMFESERFVTASNASFKGCREHDTTLTQGNTTQQAQRAPRSAAATRGISFGFVGQLAAAVSTPSRPTPKIPSCEVCNLARKKAFYKILFGHN